MSDHRGRFVWYELLTRDPAAAGDFYTELMGWGHVRWGGPMDYDMFTVGETPTYGMVELPEEAQQQGAPSHWLGYVYVPDRDAAVDQAVGLGATEMVKIEVPEVGEFGVVRDPQGALIALYRPEEEPEGEWDPGVGEVSWHELATTDYQAAFDFYAAMFGWELMEDMDMGEYGVYRIFGREGEQLGGIWNKPAEMPLSAWLYYVTVPSCEDVAERIPELGGEVVNGPMEVPGGDQIVQAIDPSGAMFALHSPGEGSSQQAGKPSEDT